MSIANPKISLCEKTKKGIDKQEVLGYNKGAKGERRRAVTPPIKKIKQKALIGVKSLRAVNPNEKKSSNKMRGEVRCTKRRFVKREETAGIELYGDDKKFPR